MIAIASSEMAILRRIVDTDQPILPVVAARAILKLDFSRSDLDRMNELAAKNRKGELSTDESEELDNYIRVGQTLGICTQERAGRCRPKNRCPRRRIGSHKLNGAPSS
jgi:hypothetical protein